MAGNPRKLGTGNIFCRGQGQRYDGGGNLSMPAESQETHSCMRLNGLHITLPVSKQTRLVARLAGRYISACGIHFLRHRVCRNYERKVRCSRGRRIRPAFAPMAITWGRRGWEAIVYTFAAFFVPKGRKLSSSSRLLALCCRPLASLQTVSHTDESDSHGSRKALQELPDCTLMLARPLHPLGKIMRSQCILRVNDHN